MKCPVERPPGAVAGSRQGRAVRAGLRGLARQCAGLLALAGLMALSPAPAAAAEDDATPLRLQVTEPFIEMHTGAGRGYPVFHVAGRGEWIEVLQRRTDWFKVRAAGGQEGWVRRRHLEGTLTEDGQALTLRDIALDDYLLRRVELGAAYGEFKSEPMLKVWTSYRLSDTLTVEGTLGQVQGVFSGTDYWHIGVNSEPWSHQRWSPFFGVGLGKFNNFANASLVSAAVTNSNLAHGMLGVRLHLSERFVARADYSIYTAFIADDRTDEFRALTIGLSFFF
jgi:hypothetical protein